MTPAKTATTSLFSAPLGRSSQQIQLSLIPFPEPSAGSADKARAFDFCKQALESNKHRFEFNEISAFLVLHIPGSCNAALHQVTTFGASLRSAFFDVFNLHGEGFFDSDGNRVEEAAFNLPAKERPADISVFSVRVVVDPAAYAPEGATMTNNPAMTMTYCLNLPQTTVYTTTGQTTIEAFSTPKKTKTLDEFTNNDNGTNDWSKVGLPDGTDVLEDYNLDVIVKMPSIKRKILARRSAALKLRPISTALFRSPRLAGALSGNEATVTTYTGAFDFMTDQETFDKNFFIAYICRLQSRDARFGNEQVHRLLHARRSVSVNPDRLCWRSIPVHHIIHCRPDNSHPTVEDARSRRSNIIRSFEP